MDKVVCGMKYSIVKDKKEFELVPINPNKKVVIIHDDCLYMINDGEIIKIKINKDDIYKHEKFYFVGEALNGTIYEIPFSSYGEQLFTTLEEAEKKLEEMKNVKL